MILYVVMPIDFWSGWQSPSDLYRVSIEDAGPQFHDPADWGSSWAKAQELAHQAGWEGDIRDGPYVTVLPEAPGGYGLPPVVIAWKQENDGTTFVATPFELPWVSAVCTRRVEG